MRIQIETTNKEKRIIVATISVLYALASAFTSVKTMIFYQWRAWWVFPVVLLMAIMTGVLCAMFYQKFTKDLDETE